MKKQTLTLLILFLPGLIFTQVSKNDLSGKLGITLYTGVNVPVSGSISSTVKTTDYFNVGPQYGFGINYYFTKDAGIEVNSLFNLNFNKKNYKLNGKTSGIYTYSFSVNGIYNFGNLLHSTKFLPYVKGGVGLYTWKHLDDAPWNSGEVVKINSNEYTATDFGFNVAAGADYKVSRNFSIGILFDYNIYFPKDEGKFGKDFSGQGNITPQLKFTYNIPVIK